MDVKKYLNYESKYIPIDIITKMDERVLDDLYASSDNTERFNIFFYLQNEYFYLLKHKKNEEAAHVCYLISYYLFTALTPPNSEMLAEEYALKAIKLNSIPKYLEWIDELKNGN